MNESHEAFAGLFEPYVRCGFLLCDSRPCLFFVLFDRDSLCLKKNFVGSEIIDGSRIRSHRIPSELLVEIFRERSDDRVVTVSYLTRNIVINKYGIDPAKVVTVHNAVDFSGRENISVERGVRDKVVTFLGRITFQKGPEPSA